MAAPSVGWFAANGFGCLLLGGVLLVKGCRQHVGKVGRVCSVWPGRVDDRGHDLQVREPMEGGLGSRGRAEPVEDRALQAVQFRAEADLVEAAAVVEPVTTECSPGACADAAVAALKWVEACCRWRRNEFETALGVPALGSMLAGRACVLEQDLVFQACEDDGQVPEQSPGTSVSFLDH